MLNTITNAFLRSIIAYLLLFAVTRSMGRKAVSQMTFFDFATTITLGSITANLGIGGNTSPISAATVLITFGILAIILGILYTKSFRIRKTVNSEPVTIIENGNIVKENMKKTRVTLQLLNTMLREKNMFNIADVEFAILENDGKLSVLPKASKQPLTPSDMNIATQNKGLTKDIIIDGNIMYENLKDAHLDEKWLVDELKKKNLHSAKDVFFAALDGSGNLYVSTGLAGKETPGKYGIE